MDLNVRSVKNLVGVNKVLVSLVYRVVNLYTEKFPNQSFVITEGLRTKERQVQLKREGKSKTLNSKHITGHAIDVAIFVDDKLTWEHKHYKDIADLFKQAAKEAGVKITWGGDWVSFVDGPHFEIDPNVYK